MKGEGRRSSRAPVLLRSTMLVPALLAPLALASIVLAPFVLAPSAARAETFPRISAAEGTVVAHKSGEEAQFVDDSNWRPVDVDQDLLAGDTLRTNTTGNLTIRFTDKSLVRMGRNTTMLVKKISSTTDSVLELTEGAIWARAARGGSKVQVDTPAATAAIRGTDWTLRVSGKQTTLTVLEGSVELSNAQGSVIVNQGEGATATLGQAPRKYTLVNLEEREQMMIYNELRDVFTEMSPSGLDGTRSRAERRRVLAADASRRSADDWLSLAETALSVSGRDEARAALSHLKRPLEGSKEARAQLVEAMLAGQEMQYARAAALFAAAMPALPRDRKATAAYGLWFARSLAEPGRAFPPPSEAAYADDPAAALARADAVAFLKGPAEAIDSLKAAEKRFPGDARFPAARAALALQLDRRDEVKEALARAKALDPDDPSHLLTSAQFRSVVSSDVDGALADLQHAVAVAPGDGAIWNEIGLVQFERNAIVEADAAHRKAISVNPENPAVHANYARFLMDSDQVAAAKREIDVAAALDPNAYPVLAAKGRYLLKIGKTAEGEKALLDAVAVSPTYGEALIGLAIATYQQNAAEETMQALDNADRFDPNNPSISLIRSAIAVDQFRADEAIVEAREALRRRQQRGGYYMGYDVNRQASSYLGITLGNLGMDEWAQYHADRSADPFKSTTYADESTQGRLSPFVGLPPIGLDRLVDGSSTASSELQAQLLDPLALASETRRYGMERRSFVEGSLTGILLDQGARHPGWSSNAQLQGTSYAGIPISYSLTGEFSRPESEWNNDGDDAQGGMFKLGARPTLNDSVVLFGYKNVLDHGFPGQTIDPSPVNYVETTSDVLGGAWSHVIEERNTLQLFAVRSNVENHVIWRTDNDKKDIDQLSSDRYWAFGLGHMLGIGPVTLRYGAEMTQIDTRFSETVTRVKTGKTSAPVSFADENSATLAYLDATLDLSRDLQIQAGVHRNRFDDISSLWGPLDFRLGVAWSPVQNHWLRAYYRQDTQFPSNYTLSPVSTVGLSPLDLPLTWGGQTQTAALRWDAEWTDRFFTSVEYQHQKFNGLALGYEDIYATSLTWKGRIDRLNLSANYWIGGGFGSFASLTFNESRDLSGLFEGEPVPLVPEQVAQVGLKYIHPSRVTALVAQNFVGRRLGAQFITGKDKDKLRSPEIDGYSTTDAALTWTSPSGNLNLNLSVTNIFDQRVESAYIVPAPGRTIWAGVTTKF